MHDGRYQDSYEDRHENSSENSYESSYENSRADRHESGCTHEGGCTHESGCTHEDGHQQEGSFNGQRGGFTAPGALQAAEVPRGTRSPDAGSETSPASIPRGLHSIINRRDTWLGRGDLCRDLHGEQAADAFQARRAANGDLHYHEQLPTGFGALDARLCEQGWPLGTSIEVLSDASGMGAMGLFLPAMETLSRQQRWQAFIAPPYTPYAPLLDARGIDTRQVLLVHPRDREELLWSTEQALRSGTCSVVFSWLGSGEYRYAELRRLQLAAARSNTLAVLFRPREAAHQHAPAALRLQMKAYREVHILKQRSGLQGIDVFLPPEDDIPHQPQLWELPADSVMTGNRAVS